MWEHEGCRRYRGEGVIFYYDYRHGVLNVCIAHVHSDTAKRNKSKKTMPTAKSRGMIFLAWGYLHVDGTCALLAAGGEGEKYDFGDKKSTAQAAMPQFTKICVYFVPTNATRGIKIPASVAKWCHRPGNSSSM